MLKMLKMPFLGKKLTVFVWKVESGPTNIVFYGIASKLSLMNEIFNILTIWIL